MASFAFERKRKARSMGLNLDRFRKNRPSEWVEWLSDDPLPSKPQQATPVQPMQPQVHRPAAYSPVQRPATQIPVQHVASTPSRPMAPPGVAQPIQPPAPAQRPVAQPSVAMSPVRPIAPPKPTQQAPQPIRPVAAPAPLSATPPRAMRPAFPQRPMSMARPLQSFTPASMVQSFQQSPIVQAMTPSSPAALSIQISMPKFKLPDLPYKRMGYWAGSVAIVGVLTVGGWTAYQHYGKKNQVAVKGVSTIHTAPTFDPLAPQSKPELGEGKDPASTAYDGKRNLYTFKDNLMGFPLVISQQPLPDNLKKNPSELEKVAKSMGKTVASTDTAYGKVYITTTEDGNAQRVVFVYKDVMVFVQSYKIFDADTWKFYVESLRQ